MCIRDRFLVFSFVINLQAAHHQAQKEDWGVVDGKAVSLYALENRNGVVAKITNYGALLTSLHLPDRDGKLSDVVLGFDNLQGYLDGHPYFGCTVGRVANRIANGKFNLGGQEYTLATNNAPNHLHGGDHGFDKKVWTVLEASNQSIKMAYISPDGEENYPGKLTATVVYSLSNNDDALRIEMSATTDATTIVNLVNHSYWNLAGHNSGDILNHELMLNASAYTPVDSTFIPTGIIDSVIKSNEKRKLLLTNRICAIMKNKLKNKIITFLQN